MVGVEQEWVVRAVHTSARSAARKHDGYAEFEDLVQEGFLYLLEHPELMEEDTKESHRILAKSVYYAMNRYGLRQRYAKDGTRPDDYFRYTSVIVEELLPEALGEVPAMRSPSDTSESRSMKSPSESGDRMAMVADVQQAFTRLKETDREILLDKYFGGDVSEEVLAITHGVTADAIRKRVSRALVRLAKSLNGDYEPHQKRKVRSNASAQVYTRRQEQAQ